MTIDERKQKWESDKPKILNLYIEQQVHELIFACLHKKMMLQDDIICLKDIEKSKVDEIIEKIKELLL